jgi:pimeloyl-ACP methyl ester carboxylesterase
MGIQKFHLCGHSLGGYAATKYAGSHQKNVLSLTLLSPAGMWPVPANINKELNRLLKQSNFITSAILKKVKNYWVPNRSPFQLLRNFGLCSLLYLKTYVQSYLRLEKAERKDLMRYLFQILMNRGTGKLAMSYILHPIFFFCLFQRERMSLIH